jgi:hypothetical protein
MAPSGKFTLGLCDRCSQRYSLGELKWEIVNSEQTGRRLCADCWDVDHPQYRLSKVKLGDEFTVPDIRPQSDADATRVYNWADMMGNVNIPSGLHVSATVVLGAFTVVIT